MAEYDYNFGKINPEALWGGPLANRETGMLIKGVDSRNEENRMYGFSFVIKDNQLIVFAGKFGCLNVPIQVLSQFISNLMDIEEVYGER
ncbi:hypothetical protein [Eubacterium sp.]|uniref:hypothetical protein n=1 Tax=Eubacterium sp. TaxID=142586 RepID=UPI002FCB4431